MSDKASEKRGRIMYCYHSKICDGINLYNSPSHCPNPIKLHILTPDELRDELKAAWDAALNMRDVVVRYANFTDWYEQYLKEKNK